MRCWVGLALLAATGGCNCASDGGPGHDGGPIGFDVMAPDGGVDAGIADGGDVPDTWTPTDGGMGRECVLEECDDGLDNDCDMMVDEECPCAPGTTASCFRGDPRHRGVGLCADGTMLCTGTAEFGTWGACEGDVLEGEEQCDEAGEDEDCNGAPNDGCECSEGDPDFACGTSVGECELGVQRCVGGVRLGCEGAVGPASETCNGLDDDCDGDTDESLVRVCGSMTGVCRTGVERCADGLWGACEGGMPASAEVCDGLDNDCDGAVDEMVTRSCGTDVGACTAGTETCAAGVWSACVGRVDAMSETCNGVDDDCDGMVDEVPDRSCGTGVGACMSGAQACVAGAWGACAGEVGPTSETCDGVLDDDCDGTVDEGCGCTSGMGRSCGTDVGECSSGTQTCDAGGMWGPCMGDIGPTAERCNGADDDCDGTIDEGCDCITGVTRACGSSVGLCVTGTETCDAMGRWGPCLGGVAPSMEVCNLGDDDCDGMVDEGGVCPTFPPTVMCPMGQATLVGAGVMLSGSGSDPDGGAVSFDWTVVMRPLGSTASPMPATAASTSFTPDVAGGYTLRLCVTDDEMETTCCTVTVTATPSCTPPVAPTISTCPTSWDRRPVVEVPPLPAGVTYELFKDADAVPYATVTMVDQNYHRPAAALGAGGPPPGTSMSIYARACLAGDPMCCSVSAAVTTALVQDCSAPVPPSSTNVVFSEYVINGDGACPGASCEAGEAIEITNLSHCPVALDGSHFGYCNPSSCGAFRWMDFGPADIIPPRGVFVAIRNRPASMCAYPFFGPDDPSLFGLKISTLAMMGSNLASGWFNNSGGGMSVLRIATGPWIDISSGTTLELVAPYSGAAAECESIGFDAVDQCGNISAVATPTDRLMPNQLGRLWHPCDAVVAPVPAMCR